MATVPWAWGLETFFNGDPNDWAAADFDQDGNLDFIRTCSHSFIDNVAVLYGTGAGLFVDQESFSIPTSASLATPKAVTVADFNEDGWLDFATANALGEDVVVRLGQGGRGAGAFGSPIPTPVGSPGPRDLAVADFNGDGHLDVALPRNTRVTLLYGDGTGAFPTSADFLGVFPALALTVGDFNQDGWPDLAATGSLSTLDEKVFYFPK